MRGHVHKRGQHTARGGGAPGRPGLWPRDYSAQTLQGAGTLCLMPAASTSAGDRQPGGGSSQVPLLASEGL